VTPRAAVAATFLGHAAIVGTWAARVPAIKHNLDLSDTASIDAAIAELGGPINALFSCAGVADGTPGIERINFLGHRYMIEKLLEADLLPRGSAIGMISSAAGLGWENSLDEVKAYLDIADFHEAAQWARDNNKADYMWSKKSVCAYVAREAFPLLQKGIRINAILPGPTNTPLAQANADMWLTFGQDYRDATGTEAYNVSAETNSGDDDIGVRQDPDSTRFLRVETSSGDAVVDYGG